MTSRLAFSSILLASAIVVSSQMSLESDARADGVSVFVGGGSHIAAGAHVSIGPIGSLIGGLARAGAHLSASIVFADSPPPVYYAPPVYSPPPVYYAPPVYSPPPVHYAPPAPLYRAPQPRYVDDSSSAEPYEPTSRWGLGIFAGSVSVDSEEVGRDLGLLARVRLSPSLSLEGEVAKTRTTVGGRMERRIGGSVLWNPHLSLFSDLSSFLLAGGGYGQSELGDGRLQVVQAYGEVGVGIQYKLSDSLQILADYRVGARSNGDAPHNVAMGATPDATMGSPTMGQDVNYSRARLGAMLTF